MLYRFLANPVKLGLIVVGFIATLGSCSKKEYQSFEELDNANIRAYIDKNNLKVSQYKTTDLFYEVLEEGTGNPIDYKKIYPIVFTVKSLDGVYNSADTLSFGNRYADYFGYFPFSSSAAGTPTVEREGDFKEVIREILKNTDGKIRIIVPSRLMYGRNGNPDLGIPSNASLDYVVTVHDNFDEFENEWVIPNMSKRAGLSIDDLSRTEDGIYYKIVTQGTGDEISVDSTLTMNYTLKRPDGSTLESKSDYKAKLADLIPAWNKAVPLINKGGKIRFFTPSTQAYGKSGSGSVPPYASLDFEVEVKDE